MIPHIEFDPDYYKWDECIRQRRILEVRGPKSFEDAMNDRFNYYKNQIKKAYDYVFIQKLCGENEEEE